MKILMSAYSCEPGKGSEPGVGWNFVRAVAKYHEVWVLTRPDEGREVIEAELARNPIPNLHFVTSPANLGWWVEVEVWSNATALLPVANSSLFCSSSPPPSNRLRHRPPCNFCKVFKT
jgi:hypothetical protein